MTQTRLPQDAEALELRFATRLAAGLTERAAATRLDIAERLRFAREQALARARESRKATLAPAAAYAGHGTLALGGPPAWWQRVASILPLLLLAVGLLLISERVAEEQMLAAAEIDAVLLADDLPPEAYSDPGFAEFLKSPQP
jgi:Protein of unknown function (DUF3619)